MRLEVKYVDIHGSQKVMARLLCFLSPSLIPTGNIRFEDPIHHRQIYAILYSYSICHYLFLIQTGFLNSFVSQEHLFKSIVYCLVPSVFPHSFFCCWKNESFFIRVSLWEYSEYFWDSLLYFPFHVLIKELSKQFCLKLWQ